MSVRHAFSFQCCRTVLFSTCHWEADILNRINNEKYYCTHIYTSTTSHHLLTHCVGCKVIYASHCSQQHLFIQPSLADALPNSTAQGNRQQHLFSTTCQSGDLRRQQQQQQQPDNGLNNNYHSLQTTHSLTHYVLLFQHHSSADICCTSMSVINTDNSVLLLQLLITMILQTLTANICTVLQLCPPYQADHFCLMSQRFHTASEPVVKAAQKSSPVRGLELQ